MPDIGCCAIPEQMPPLEPLSEASSLHDSPTAVSSPSGGLPSIIPKEKLDNDASRLLADVFLPFKASLVLENKGNVARDHLACERTYLAYVGTSLATSSAGVALVQLFTLSPKNHLSKFAKPLGATMVLFALFILIHGAFRYFITQNSLVRGRFPAARNSITVIAFAIGSFVGIVFGILVADTHR